MLVFPNELPNLHQIYKWTFSLTLAFPNELPN